MPRVLFALLTGLLLTACTIGPQGYWRAPDRADLNQQKDDLECAAIASQAAQGAGGWTSVAPMRDAIYQQARQDAYNQCVSSRGYQWVIAP